MGHRDRVVIGGFKIKTACSLFFLVEGGGGSRNKPLSMNLYFSYSEVDFRTMVTGTVRVPNAFAFISEYA